ncbi:TetR/AcrR family transcriptional regulator [Streptomyces sp. JJ38]|uniref:TetR/AcrR family transcriptional regulator n=1 Tax=Streptomyces sp. JJ38 TaxID=2738128 RepID=UPI001C584103|nr:TetR/AcrR family transcriptional regulator [Streptomyces sp. JJ38]MBW1597049.1 TetR/AcrR family transcriptional regulator [Streptomyces sp. JJ38]
MGAIRTPRRRWIEEGLRALAAGGVDAVRIEPLAQALGVSKGGFYGFFRNRGALLEDMLDTWEREVTEEVIDAVESGGGDAREKLDRLFSYVENAEAADAPTKGAPVELAIRDWARRDESVAERLRRVDNRRMDYLRSLFDAICDDEVEAEVRSLITFSLRIGTYFIAAEHRGRSRDEVMRLARRHLLR